MTPFVAMLAVAMVVALTIVYLIDRWVRHRSQALSHDVAELATRVVFLSSGHFGGEPIACDELDIDDDFEGERLQLTRLGYRSWGRLRTGPGGLAERFESELFLSPDSTVVVELSRSWPVRASRVVTKETIRESTEGLPRPIPHSVRELLVPGGVFDRFPPNDGVTATSIVTRDDGPPRRILTSTTLVPRIEGTRVLVRGGFHGSVESVLDDHRTLIGAGQATRIHGDPRDFAREEEAAVVDALTEAGLLTPPDAEGRMFHTERAWEVLVRREAMDQAPKRRT